MVLVSPSFVLLNYSQYPTKFDVDRWELLYYLSSGVLTWLFHSQLTLIVSQPKMRVANPQNYIMAILVIAYFGAVITDKIAFDKMPSSGNIVAACFMIIPALIFDMGNQCFNKEKSTFG